MFGFGKKKDEQYLDVAPNRRALVLDFATGIAKTQWGVISDRLMPFAGRKPTPFDAVLIDLAEREYRFTSGDLAAVAGTMAAWNRGWVAPVAIVMRGDGAASLRKVLQVVTLDRLTQLRIVETREEGLAHIRETLARVTGAPAGRGDD
jgi:hypothetical protein